MSNKTFHPLVVAYGVPKDTGIVFILPGREVTIDGADDILSRLLSRCNGYTDAEEIVASVSTESDYGEEGLRQLLNILREHRILVDAHDYYHLFHIASTNPMPFVQNISNEERGRMLLEGKSPLVQRPWNTQTPLGSLLEKRESIRDFTGEPLSQKELLGLGWAVYGKTARSDRFLESAIGLGTVPSGGALYPLRLFVAVLRTSSSAEQGVYQLGPEGLRFQDQLDRQRLDQAFAGYPTPIQNAGAVLVLACDFQQTTQKYSNRGYRYALLEAGHAAQNAYLWCTEQRLGVVEIGGFNDEHLAKLLNLTYPAQAPLITLMIGRRTE